MIALETTRDGIGLFVFACGVIGFLGVIFWNARMVDFAMAAWDVLPGLLMAWLALSIALLIGSLL